MPAKNSSSSTAGRLVSAAFVAIAIVIVMASVAYAVVYDNINLTDNSVAEWSANGIQVFQTDPAGDATSARDDEDIVNGWVASSDTDGDMVADQLNFLVQVNTNPALGLAQRAVVASIDCDGDNVDQEFEDRLVLYRPDFDFAAVFHGNQAGTYAGLGAAYGQRVGNYLEWGVPVEYLGSFPDDDPAKPDGYCQNNGAIRFAIANIQLSPAQALDLTDPLRGWNTPNAVSLRGFAGASGAPISAGWALLALGAVTGTAWLALSRRNKR